MNPEPKDPLLIELTVFLGNPEPEYAHNRHNAGWLLAERLPFAASLNWQKKYKGRYAALDSPRLTAALSSQITADQGASQTGSAVPPEALPARFHFLKPETYMNLSGESIHAAASFFKIPPERILLVHDELELPLGAVSLKFSGGLGGHNGLRSMKAVFGTADFWRLRIGIGRPGDREPGKGGRPGRHGDISGWVLSDFDKADLPTLDQVLTAAAAALTEVLLRGPKALLPEWNKKNVIGAQ
jgi:PTH1 family peptidyl-tRNA hydrolase